MWFKADRITLNDTGQAIVSEKGELWAVHLLDNRLETLCCMAAPEDTIADWHGAWWKLKRDHPEQLTNFLAQAHDLLDCRFYAKEDRPILMRVLFGLVEGIQNEPRLALSDRENENVEQVINFLAKAFVFEQIGAEIRIGISFGSQPDDKPYLRRLNAAADPTQPETWLAAFYKWEEGTESDNPDFLNKVIQHFNFLYSAAKMQQDDAILQMFVAFSRALAERVECIERYQPYRHRLADMYEVIARHADNPNVARQSLLRLLGSEGTLAEKWPRLIRLLHGLKRVCDRQGSLGGEQGERLLALTSLIANHYQNRYYLPCAGAAWRRLQIRDPVLRTILFVHQHPFRMLVLYGLAFLLLTGLARVPQQVLSPSLGELVLLFLLAGPLLAFCLIIAYSLKTRRLLYGYYNELLLPRVFISIIVGLALLMLDDLPWKIALRASDYTLLLILAIYFLYYLYVLIDVYKTIRFEPWPECYSETRRFWSRFFEWMGLSDTLEHSVRIALLVFVIGIVQSFLVTLFVSGLVLPLVLDIFEDGAVLLQKSAWGWVSVNLGGADFIFVPTLVFLWTGLALFIGTFVQLLWQEGLVRTLSGE